jgi:hypothetical protein
MEFIETARKRYSAFDAPATVTVCAGGEENPDPERKNGRKQGETVIFA